MASYIGTAGWNIPTHLKEKFSNAGTHLQRYAQMLNAVEINTAFYRDHKPETYVKWAASVPNHFRFSVKLFRYFTHMERLRVTGPQLTKTMEGILQLKEKLGVLLVQLPPSLEFDHTITKKFVHDLRKLYSGIIVWEPRHLSWTHSTVVPLFQDYKIHRVIADPEPCPITKEMAPLIETVQYFRLHGSPEIYKSRYNETAMQSFEKKLIDINRSQSLGWFVFDNTTYGYATENALELQKKNHASGEIERLNKDCFI